jgi:hypothetical protein
MVESFERREQAGAGLGEENVKLELIVHGFNSM